MNGFKSNLDFGGTSEVMPDLRMESIEDEEDVQSHE